MDASTLQRNLGGYTVLVRPNWPYTDLHEDCVAKLAQIVTTALRYGGSVFLSQCKVQCIWFYVEMFDLLGYDENLWIASRLIWFDQPRAPEKFYKCSNIQISFKATGSEDEASQTAPVRIGP
ncbi:hypothetical protein STEG23_013956 [Scotinomys teguina]